jgi:hypothetical protein
VPIRNNPKAQMIDVAHIIGVGNLPITIASDHAETNPKTGFKNVIADNELGTFSGK